MAARAFAPRARALPLLLLLLAAAVPPADGALVRSFYYNTTQYLTDAAGTYLGFITPSLRPMNRFDMMAYSVQFEEDIFVRPHECVAGNCCSGPTVARCCKTCDTVTLLPSGTGNAPGCMCPSRAEATCVDDVTQLSGMLNRQDQRQFEIGVVGACQNLVVKLDVAYGDINLSMEPGSGKIPDLSVPGEAFAYYAANPGSDSLTMCCGALDGLPYVSPYWEAYSGAAPFDGNRFSHSPRRTLASVVLGGPSSHQGIARLNVAALSQQDNSTYTLSLELGTAADPLLLRPLRDHWWWPSKTELTCTSPVGESFTCTSFAQGLIQNNYPCLLAPIPALHPNDSFALFERTLGSLTHDTLDTSVASKRQYDFYMVIGDNVAGAISSIFLPYGSATNCTLKLGDLYNAAGQPLFTQTIGPLKYIETGECNYAALEEQLALYRGVLADAAVTPAPTSDRLNERELTVSSILASSALRNCQSHFASFVTDWAPVYVANTTMCPYARDTPEYAADPCCNVQLSGASCCFGRTIALTAAQAPNSLVTAQQCAEPACADRVLSNTLQLADIRQQLSESCDFQALTVARALPTGMRNPLTYSPIWDGACYQYVYMNPRTYRSATAKPFAPYSPELVDCVTNALLAVPELANEFSTAYFGFSAKDPGPAGFAAAFAAALKARYIRPHCIQSGMPFFPNGTQRRRADLDADPALCEATPSCNWDPLRSAAECVNAQSFRGRAYCGLCDAHGFCLDYSDQNACIMHRNFYAEGMPTVCARLGGVLLENEARVEDRSRTAQWCYLPSVTDELSCLNPPNASEAIYGCPPGFPAWGGNYNAFYGWNYDLLGIPATEDNGFCDIYGGPFPCNHNCYDYCIIPSLGPGNCSCDALAPTDPWVVSGDCEHFRVLGGSMCAGYKVARDFDCTQRGGVYYGGRMWHYASLSTEAACRAEEGICTTAPGIPKDFCAGVASCTSCDAFNDPACNQTVCEATLGCNDFADFPDFRPVCVLPAQFNWIDLLPNCAYWGFAFPTLTKGGCASYYFQDPSGYFTDGTSTTQQNETTCAFFGGQWYYPAGANATQCNNASTSLLGCFEAKGALGDKINTFKSPAECARCGGQLRPLYSMEPGRWKLVGGWRDLTWVNRTFAPSYKYAAGFFHNNFTADWNALMTKLQADTALADKQCNFGAQFSALESLSCSCLDGSATGGADCFAPRGSLQKQLLLCSGNEIAPPLQVASALLSVSPAVDFNDGCSQLSTYLIPLSSYALKTPRLYSSLFLQSTAPSPFAVLLNDRRVPVAQLVGDGIQLDFTVEPANVSNAAQAIVLCFSVQQPPSDERMSVPDFARMDASLRLSSLTILEADVKVVGGMLCAAVNGSDRYIPIYRYPNWRSRTFRSTLVHILSSE